MDTDTSLVLKKDTVFHKITSFFKKLFNIKASIEEIVEVGVCDDNASEYQDVLENFEEEISEKQKMFNLYAGVKHGAKAIEELSSKELNSLNDVILDTIDADLQFLDDEDAKIEELNNDISKLADENEQIRKKIVSNDESEDTEEELKETTNEE